jgi:hypothetical protein
MTCIFRRLLHAMSVLNKWLSQLFLVPPNDVAVVDYGAVAAL